MKKTLSLLFSAVILFLEALPYGVVMRFADEEPGKYIVESFSYFSMIPYGYANFAPSITAVLSVALLITLIFSSPGRGQKTVRILSILAVVTSLLPIVIYGIAYYNIVSGLVTALLAIEFLLSFGHDG